MGFSTEDCSSSSMIQPVLAVELGACDPVSILANRLMGRAREQHPGQKAPTTRSTRSQRNGFARLNQYYHNSVHLPSGFLLDGNLCSRCTWVVVEGISICQNVNMSTCQKVGMLEWRKGEWRKRRTDENQEGTPHPLKGAFRKTSEVYARGFLNSPLRPPFSPTMEKAVYCCSADLDWVQEMTWSGLSERLITSQIPSLK